MPYEYMAMCLLAIRIQPVVISAKNGINIPRARHKAQPVICVGFKMKTAISPRRNTGQTNALIRRTRGRVKAISPARKLGMKRKIEKRLNTGTFG